MSRRWPISIGFLVPFVVCLLFGLLIEWQWGSHASSLWMNKQHSPTGDTFFKYATWLGDGLTVVIIILVLLFIQFRWALLLAVAMFVSSFLAQWLKHFFNHDRPSIIFEGLDLHWVPGVDLYGHYSFPSGHTTAAFCLYGMLAFFSARKSSQLLFFATACLVGISRIYLMQHFLEDVLFGAVLGYGTAFLVVKILGSRKFLETPVWDRSLLRLRKK